MATFKLLAVGDSNTIGPTPPVAWTTWAPRVLSAVQAALPSDTITLTNNAAGSTASYDLWANRATLVEDESPSVVIIAMGGTNDAYYDDPLNGYPRGDGQDYSAAAWRSRMNTIVAGALALTDASGHPTRVVMCSAPPAHPQSYPGSLSWRDPVRLEAIRDQAADLVADLADDRVLFVDLWTEMQTNASWQTAYINTADGGVHLSDAGQQEAADLILPAVLVALSAPIIASAAAGGITETAATITATVNPRGYATTYRVEHGLTTGYGTNTGWTSAGSGSSPVAIEVDLSGLVPGTAYHARVVATSAAGTTNGADIEFTTDTPEPGLILDPSSIWEQDGTAITARALTNRRSTVMATAYSETGGAIWGDGADVARFDIDGEPVDGETTITLTAGVPARIELGVTPLDEDDELLTVRIGIPE